jgi:hypothetical protein
MKMSQINKKSGVINKLKNVSLKISGYRSPFAEIYKSTKRKVEESKGTTEVTSYEDMLEKSNQTGNVANVSRSLRATCYVLLSVFIYTTYKLFGSSGIVDILFCGAILSLSALMFIKYRYHLWIVDNKALITFRKWIGLVPKNLSILIP